MSNDSGGTGTCISDCSLLDLDTCTPLTNKEMNAHLEEKELQSLLYDLEGCYNSTIFRSTQSYQSYESVLISISILTILTGLLGLVFNLFAIVVLTRKEMKNCFNQILIAVNIFDSLHLLFAMVDTVRTSFVSAYPKMFLLAFPYFHYPLYRISLCASIYLIIGVAVERYFAVCKPHYYREAQAKGFRSFRYIVPSIVISVLLNTTRFLETEAVKMCVDFSVCGCHDLEEYVVYLKPTSLRLTRDYIIYYGTWGWIIATGFIPFLVLLVLNLQIYLALRAVWNGASQEPNQRRACVPPTNNNDENGELTEQQRQRRANQQNKENNLAIVLLTTVLTFFVCHLPRVLTSVYEAVNINEFLDCREKGRDQTPLWYLYSMLLVTYLQVANASLNLPIYMFASKSFKANAVEVKNEMISFFKLNSSRESSASSGEPITVEMNLIQK